MKKSLCCISLKLKTDGYSSQTMSRTRYLNMNRSDALRMIGDKIINNLNVLYKLIHYCNDNSWNLRIGSDLLPLITLSEAKYSIDELPQKDIINSLFCRCKEYIKNNNLRCSMHPSPYAVLASANSDVVSNSIIEIDNHAYIMDMLGLPSNHLSPINIHINCFKNMNLDDVISRFIEGYNKLQPSAKQRLTVECEDKPNSWNVRLLYDKLYSKLFIPITYDSHHHRLNSGNLTEAEAIGLAKSTWRYYTPLFHFSNGKNSSTDNSHSTYVNMLHNELFDSSVDVEFEFKGKDLAILKFEKEFGK